MLNSNLKSSQSKTSIDQIQNLFSRVASGIDLWLLGATGFLIYISLTVLKFSERTYGYYEKQVDFLIAGVILMIIFARIPYRFWTKKWMIPVIYLANLGLLVAVMIKGHSAQGAQRWLNIGPIIIQPSEISKIIVIIAMAAWLKYFPIRSFWDIFKLAAIVLPPAFLVFKQPDLGTSLTFGVVFLGMSYWMGATIADIVLMTSPVFTLVLNAVNPIWSYWFIGFVGVFLLLFWRVKNWNFFIRLALILAVVGANYGVGEMRPHLWGHLKEYQQKRLISFVNPYADPRGSGYHILQSLIAIGSGGIAGAGLGKGNQAQGEFIPERHTDFIFAVVGEELGFKISVLVVFAYLIICVRAVRIAYLSKAEPEGSAMAIGLMCMFLFHCFINMGMTMGMMPVTGVPLPFLSYGGTALIVDLIALGLLQSVYAYIPKPKKDAWG